ESICKLTDGPKTSAPTTKGQAGASPGRPSASQHQTPANPKAESGASALVRAYRAVQAEQAGGAKSPQPQPDQAQSTQPPQPSQPRPESCLDAVVDATATCAGAALAASGPTPSHPIAVLLKSIIVAKQAADCVAKAPDVSAACD